MFKAEILILSILIIESFQPLLGQLRAGSSLEYVYFIFLKYIFNIMSQYSLPSIKWKNNLNLQRKAKTNTYKNVNQHIIKEHLKVNDLIWKKKKKKSQCLFFAFIACFTKIRSISTYGKSLLEPTKCAR